MFSSVVELLQKELQFLRKTRRPSDCKLSPEERVRLFMKTQNFLLVELLEERWRYGCDLDIDLCRVQQLPITWDIELKKEPTSLTPETTTSTSPAFTTTVVSPHFAQAFALAEGKSTITFEDEVKYLSKI